VDSNERYVCLWPECGAATTQLGELKSHYASQHLPVPPTTSSHLFSGFDDVFEIYNHRLKCHIGKPDTLEKAWMVINKSLDRRLLSICHDCFSHKVYATAEEAITHLRQNHLNPTKKRKRSSQSRDDLMWVNDIESWVTEVEINTNVLEKEVISNNFEGPRPFLQISTLGTVQNSIFEEVPQLPILTTSLEYDTPVESTVVSPTSRDSKPRYDALQNNILESFPPCRNVTPISDYSNMQEFAKESEKSLVRQQHLFTPEDSPTPPENVQPVPQSSTVTIISDLDIEGKKLTFLPLHVGHPMLRRWNEVLPSVRQTIKEILGSGNKASVDFCSFQGVPSICISCNKPGKIDKSLLERKTKEWGFPAVIAKSSKKKSYGPGGKDPRISWSVPAVNSRHNRRADCGSSLGTINGPFDEDKVSLGGYLKLKHQSEAHWTLYAATVHHAIEPREDYDYQSDSDSSDTAESRFSTNSNGETPGIINGVLGGFEGEISFCSPARVDFMQAQLRRDQLNRLCQLRPGLAQIFGSCGEGRLISHKDTAFGKARWSSGLCKDNGSKVT
jgi:hypothetical protein